MTKKSYEERMDSTDAKIIEILQESDKYWRQVKNAEYIVTRIQEEENQSKGIE